MAAQFKPKTSIENAAIELYGLSQGDIQSLSVQRNGRTTVLDVTLRPDYPPCPHCGHPEPSISNYVVKRITHSVLQEQSCLLIYNARRYKCSFCRRTYYEHNPFVFKRQRISAKTVMDVLEGLREASATFSSVAKRFGLSPTTVQNIFDEHVSFPPAAKLPRVLQIDETYSFKSEDSCYVCLILDYDRQEPVDLLPNRKKKDLLAYFRSFPMEERNNVEFIAADMYKVYKDVCQSVFPKAVYACDRFHVSQEFSRKLTQVRIRVMKGVRTDSDSYYLLKKQSSLLNIRPDAKRKKKNAPKRNAAADDFEYVLDPAAEKEYNAHFKKWMNTWELQQKLLEINDELRKSYEFRNQLSSFFRDNTLETAPAALDKLIQDMDASRIPEIMAFADTLRTWHREVIHSFHIVKVEYETTRKGTLKKKDRRLTSSMIENRNKYVKQIKNNANGYTNWKRFRNRVLFVLKKTTTLHQGAGSSSDSEESFGRKSKNGKKNHQPG